jgi:N-acetylmuramoyl-L-alanine amidase
MKKKYFSLSLIAIILSIFFTQILFSAPLNVVKSVKFYKFGKSEKITFLLNNKFPKFRYYLEKSKKSFVLNLERSKLKRNIIKVPSSFNYIKSISSFKTLNKNLKLRINLTGKGYQVIVYPLKSPSRIVISIRKKTKIKRSKSYNKSNVKIDSSIQNNLRLKFLNRKGVIVLDPGHGGRDPGAVGVYRNNEKFVNLDVSKRLFKILKYKYIKNNKIFMTRQKDRYVSLNLRRRFSNKKNADIFISIHSNSSRRRTLNGIETYFYNRKASSRRSYRLALRENMQTERVGSNLDKIFGDMWESEKIIASKKLAELTQNTLVRFLRINNYKVTNLGTKYAPFAVLKNSRRKVSKDLFPTVSILIEIGFLSNKIESRRLLRDTYRQKIAEGIALGVKSYILK